jgi:hypothetical protein
MYAGLAPSNPTEGNGSVVGSTGYPAAVEAWHIGFWHVPFTQPAVVGMGVPEVADVIAGSRQLVELADAQSVPHTAGTFERPA